LAGAGLPRIVKGAAGWICRGLFTRGAPILCILTPDKRNLNIPGAITGRGLFCVALPDRPGQADTIEGGWCAPWGFARRGWIWFADGPAFADTIEGGCFGPWGFSGGAWIWFPDGPAFADAVEGGWFGPWGFGGELEFSFLTDKHLQTLSREVGLALGDSAVEPGFGLHHRLSEEACLVAGYSPRPEETFVVSYSPMQHLIF